MVMGTTGTLVPMAVWVEKRRRLMSSSVAAGILSLLTEMNCMRTSSRVSGGVAVVGDDDADGQEAVRDVGETEEFAVLDVVAGFGGYGDVLVGVGVEGGVLVGGFGRAGLFFVGEGGLVRAAEALRAEYQFRQDAERDR